MSQRIEVRVSVSSADGSSIVNTAVEHNSPSPFLMIAAQKALNQTCKALDLPLLTVTKP